MGGRGAKEDPRRNQSLVPASGLLTFSYFLEDKEIKNEKQGKFVACWKTKKKKKTRPGN